MKKIDFNLGYSLVFIQVFRKTSYNMLFNKLLFLNDTLDGEVKYNIFKCTDYIYRCDAQNDLMSLLSKLGVVQRLLTEDPNNSINNIIDDTINNRETVFSIMYELAKTAVNNKLEDVIIFFENSKNQFMPFLSILKDFSVIIDKLYLKSQEGIIGELKEKLKKEHPDVKIEEKDFKFMSLALVTSTFLNEILQDIIEVDENYNHNIKLSPFKSELVNANINLNTYNTLIHNIVNYLNKGNELEKSEDDAINMLVLLDELKSTSLS